MTIVEYKKNAGRLETRICEEHKDQPYILGCAGCLSVFCSECFAVHNICNRGKSDGLIDRKRLYKMLVKKR